MELRPFEHREPSHIHVPRPSREAEAVRRMRETSSDEYCAACSAPQDSSAPLTTSPDFD